MSLSKLLLMALVFVFALSIYLGEQSGLIGTGSLEEESLVRHPFSELNYSSLDKLEIKQKDSSVIVSKTNAGYRLSSGVAANKEVIKQLFSGLNQLSITQEVAKKEKVSLDDFGLANPKLLVLLNLGEEKYQLNFGLEHPISKRRYFTWNKTEDIFSIDAFHYDSMIKVTEELPDNSVLPFVPDSVISIFLEPLATKPYRILRHDFQSASLGSWILSFKSGEKLTEYPADQRFVELKLDSLAKLEGKKATGVVLAEKDLLLQLSIALKEENNQGRRTIRGRIYRGAPAGSYFLENVEEAQVYEVTGGQYKDFLQGALHFRIKKPFLDQAETIKFNDSSRWLSSSIKIGEKQKEAIAHFEVLSYDVLVKESNFGRVSKSISFIWKEEPVRLSIGESIVSNSSNEVRNEDTPKYLLLEFGDQTKIQAIVSAKQARELIELTE